MHQSSIDHLVHLSLLYLILCGQIYTYVPHNGLHCATAAQTRPHTIRLTANLWNNSKRQILIRDIQHHYQGRKARGPKKLAREQSSHKRASQQPMFSFSSNEDAQNQTVNISWTSCYQNCLVLSHHAHGGYKQIPEQHAEFECSSESYLVNTANSMHGSQ